MDDTLKFLEPRSDIDRSQNRLPHWQQPGVLYFVTFRLADSLPVERLDQLRHERDCNKHVSRQIEQLLDAGAGSCLLAQSDLRCHLAHELSRFDGIRYQNHAWIIMPNHVHSVFSLAPNWQLAQVVGAWKGASARAINRIHCASGTLWQKDYFDRIIRDMDHFEQCVRYIRRNPKSAGLTPLLYTHFESAIAARVVNCELEGRLQPPTHNAGG
ncbi:MAG TPA: transposase [Kiritimatiellia bacterium]